MTPPVLPDLSLGDLGALTTRGLVALAARAARRALPLLRLTEDSGPTVDRLAAALWAAEDFAGGTDPESVAAADEIVEAAYAAADSVCGRAGYSGFAAAHAARAARFAAEMGASRDEGLFIEIVASTFGTTLVLRNSSGATDDPLIRAGLRADYDTLLRLRLGAAITAGEPVDPRENGPLGPLWPAGAPAWFS
jgi:hypothetical protein